MTVLDIVISLHVSFGRTIITCQRATLFSGIFISWRDISDLFLQRRLKRSYQAIINSKDDLPLRMQVFHTQPYRFFFLVTGLTRIWSQPEQLSGCWKVWFALHKVNTRSLSASDTFLPFGLKVINVYSACKADVQKWSHSVGCNHCYIMHWIIHDNLRNCGQCRECPAFQFYGQPWSRMYPFLPPILPYACWEVQDRRLFKKDMCTK